MRVIVLMMLVVLPALAEWAASYRLGEALLQQGRAEDAVRELKIALEERPEEVAILDALGRAEFRAGRYRSAKGYFEKASKVAVDNAVAAIKATSDFCTLGADGHGVAELIEELVATDLSGRTPRRT